MIHLKRIQNQSGQALLLVVLGMAVVLTLVLSIATRSVTDISVTTQDEESLRAFSAAEAGVEQILVGGPVGSNVSVGQGSFFGTKVDLGGGSEFIYPHLLKAGESATIWFVKHDPDGNLYCEGGGCFEGTDIKIGFGPASVVVNPPAIEVSVYYDSTGNSLYKPITNPGYVPDYSDVKIKRYAYDPLTARCSKNKFSDISSQLSLTLSPTGGSSQTFNYSTPNITLPAGRLLFARIKLIYNNNTDYGVGVKTNISDSLPAQGIEVNVTGSSASKTANRAIQASRHLENS